MVWRPTETAPSVKNVFVFLESGQTLYAFYHVDGYWCATYENQAPPCWTDGICWGSNEDLEPSIRPLLWWDNDEQEREV